MRRVIVTGLAALVLLASSPKIPDSLANSHYPDIPNFSQLVDEYRFGIGEHYLSAGKKGLVYRLDSCDINKAKIRDLYYLFLDYDNFASKVLAKEEEISSEITNSNINLYPELLDEWNNIKKKVEEHKRLYGQPLGNLSETLECDNLTTEIAIYLAVEFGKFQYPNFSKMNSRGFLEQTLYEKPKK